MKARILSSVALAGALAFVALRKSATVVATAPPILPTLMASWEPSTDPRTNGYFLYLGESPGNYYKPFKMPLATHLHGKCETPIWFHTPKIYAAVTVYADVETPYGIETIESPISNEVQWPIP